MDLTPSKNKKEYEYSEKLFFDVHCPHCCKWFEVHLYKFLNEDDIYVTHCDKPLMVRAKLFVAADVHEITKHHTEETVEVIGRKNK